MTNDKDIGRLEGKMDLVLGHLGTLQTAVDKIATEGCVKGKANEIAIASLAKRTLKMEGWVTKLALIVAGSAGGGVGVAKLIEAMWRG